MRRFLFLFTIWFVGLNFIILQFSSELNLALPIPILLIITLVTTPTLLLLSSQNPSKGKTLFFLLLFSVSLRLIVPLGEGGSSFVVFRDPIYTLQLTKIYMEQGRWTWGLETGTARELLLHPALNLLSVIISQVLGLELVTLSRFLAPLVFTPVTIILLFVAFERLIGSYNAMLACFIFSVCYKYNTFNSLYLQESLGIVFFVMAFYALVSKKRRRGFLSRTYGTIFILAISSMVWTHFFLGYVLLVTIAIALVIRCVVNSLFDAKYSVNAIDLMLITVLFYGWAVFIAIQRFILSYRMSYDYLSELGTFIQRPWEIGTIEKPTGINLSPLEMPLVYIGILIPISFGLLTCFYLFICQRRALSYSITWLRIFGIISFVLGAVTLLGLRGFAKQTDIPYRFVTPFYIFLSAISAVSLSAVKSKLEYVNLNKFGKRAISRAFYRGIFAVFLIIPVLSTGLLIPSFIAKPVILNDREVAVGSSWLSVYANKSLVVIGETALAEPVAAYSRLDFWRDDRKAYLNNQTITDMIYYGGNMSDLVNFLQGREERFLLIVNKRFIIDEHYRLRYYYETKIPSLDSANLSFQILSQLRILNKIYESESLYLFLVTRERYAG